MLNATMTNDKYLSLSGLPLRDKSVLLHTQKENVPMKDIDFYKRNTGISKPGHKYNYCPFTFWSQIKTFIIL